MVLTLRNDSGQDMTYLKGLGRLIIQMLEDKTFDIVSFHSKYNSELVVLERCKLKSNEIVVKDTLVKIPLDPYRSISFDLNENPVLTIESHRQIKIVRKLNSKDTVTRIILINKKD